MHIKSITLSNFRSFKQQPEIHPFSSEMNCVVGRNGSGKSNLFDAVQFVLGCPKFWSLRTVSCAFVCLYVLRWMFFYISIVWVRCVCVVSDLCNDVWYGVVHDIITNWTRGQGRKGCKFHQSQHVNNGVNISLVSWVHVMDSGVLYII